MHFMYGGLLLPHAWRLIGSIVMQNGDSRYKVHQSYASLMRRLFTVGFMFVEEACGGWRQKTSKRGLHHPTHTLCNTFLHRHLLPFATIKPHPKKTRLYIVYTVVRCVLLPYDLSTPHIRSPSSMPATGACTCQQGLSSCMLLMWRRCSISHLSCPSIPC